MKTRVLFGFSAVLAFTTSAGAASLAITTDKLQYAIGETITLTVTGDDGGASTYGIFGRLNYSGFKVKNGTTTQTKLTGQHGSWVTGLLSQGDNNIDAFSDAFNQIPAFLPGDTANNLPGLISTITLIVDSGGCCTTVNVNWHTGNDGFGLSFFGLTNAPGASFTIVEFPVPEPATGSLLGLGLVALALARGRNLPRDTR